MILSRSVDQHKFFCGSGSILKNFVKIYLTYKEFAIVEKIYLNNVNTIIIFFSLFFYECGSGSTALISIPRRWAQLTPNLVWLFSMLADWSPCELMRKEMYCSAYTGNYCDSAKPEPPCLRFLSNWLQLLSFNFQWNNRSQNSADGFSCSKFFF